MRPRFSLKWLLVSFAFVGVLLYLFFIRPTVIANQFVNLIQISEYHKAESLCVSESRRFSEYVGTEEVVVTVRLIPRTRDDIQRMRRRMHLRVIPVSSTEGDPKRTSGDVDIFAVVGAFGVRLDSN